MGQKLKWAQSEAGPALGEQEPLQTNDSINHIELKKAPETPLGPGSFQMSAVFAWRVALLRALPRSLSMGDAGQPLQG